VTDEPNDLWHLAAKGRPAAEQVAHAARRKAERRRAERASARAAMLDRALAPEPGWEHLLLLFGPPAVATMAGVLALQSRPLERIGPWQPLVLAGTAVVGAGLGLWLFLRSMARKKEAERRWYRSRPWAFDPAAYEAFLSRGGEMARAVRVTVTFRRTVREADAGLVEDALRAVDPDAELRWGERQGDSVLVVGSPSFSTYRLARKGSGHDNAVLHRWFRRLSDRFLLALHTSYGIRAVAVSDRAPGTLAIDDGGDRTAGQDDRDPVPDAGEEDDESAG